MYESSGTITADNGNQDPETTKHGREQRTQDIWRYQKGTL